MESLLFTAELMDFQKHPPCLRHRSTQYILVDNQGSQIPYQHIPKLAIHFWLQFNTSSLFISRFDPYFCGLVVPIGPSLVQPLLRPRPSVSSSSSSSSSSPWRWLILICWKTLTRQRGVLVGKSGKVFLHFLGSELSKYGSFIFWDLNFPPKSKYAAYHDIRATWAMCTAVPLFVPLDLAWFFFFSLLYTFHGQAGTQWQPTIFCITLTQRKSNVLDI